MRPVELVMVGAGNRGHLAYGAFAQRNPDEAKFIAVVEPDDARRARFANAHGIPAERQFHSWEEIASRSPLAPALVNATLERHHRASTLGLLAAGYEMLLEKPIAATAGECLEIATAAESHGRLLQIAHVLRYAPFFVALREIVTSGRLGAIVSVDWRENLIYWHFAHSYVRGNWGKKAEGGPIILTKCCHDLDLLVWIFGRCERLSSSGSLTHFTRDAVGPEIPGRCTDGCPIAESCPYFAPRVYLDRLSENPASFAVAAVTLDRTPEGVMRALETGPYGRCVYRAGNDVVDHQVVLMRFEGGLSVSLTMQGSSHIEGRTVRIDGMRATLLANEARAEMEIHDHRTGQVERITRPRGVGGHGGGDDGLMRAFVGAIQGDRAGVLTSAREAVASHLMAFAAERARVNDEVVDMEAFRGSL
ncbi:MAG TPA: Gfo/Idh/MocA family oxidoreductase [Methylomirabilota bacterium]|nr:Gfo/Idh/MocA family oxidoreductase [Methylomirabilota bacterium]